MSSDHSSDHTNWSCGIIHFNILMLCVVHEGIDYPLLWTVLNKQKGNSNRTGRIDLVGRFEALFPDTKIAESTHFVNSARLSKLLALLAFAFVWVMKVDLWR